MGTMGWVPSVYIVSVWLVGSSIIEKPAYQAAEIRCEMILYDSDNTLEVRVPDWAAKLKTVL